MSDTPETDAEHAQFAMGGFTLDFCRKLERERDEARQLACLYKNQFWCCASPTSVEPPKFSWEEGYIK